MAPKILLVTYPAQGHINPSLQFAKKLIGCGVHVTFMTTAFAMNQMKIASSPKGLAFASFSDGYDEQGFDLNTGDVNQYMVELERRGSQTFREFLSQGVSQGKRFAHIVYCTLLTWVPKVAREFHIRATLFWNQTATTLNVYHHFSNKGYGDVIENGIEDPSFVIKIQGLPLLGRHELPSFFIPNPFTLALPIFKEHIEILDQEVNPRVLVNSFDALEAEAMKALDKYNLVGIGPLMPSAFVDGKKPSETSFGGDLFRASKEYKEIDWLNSKPERSVIYVSFGTLSVLAKPQMEEIAKGLRQTGRPFLWVIRESGGGLSYQKELEKQGLIVPWCSQLEVLSHPSIGCFMTHSGWNSTFESLVLGVPMVVFPQWSDQPMNAKMVQDVWRTGVKVTKNEQGLVEGWEIKKYLEMVLGDGERGREIRMNAKKWKDLTREAAMENGLSDTNLKAFVDDLTT